MLKDALVNVGKESEFEQRAPAIWRCALIRTSSRPVDMVFSIMGLFGVTLDTRKFGENDRLSATIALMQAMLSRGRQASWLGVAPYLPVHPCLSTFPTFPRTSVQGQVIFESDVLETGSKEVEKRRRAILDTRRIFLPTGRMDDAGYLNISRKALQIYPQAHTEGLPVNRNLDKDLGLIYDGHLPQLGDGVSLKALDGTIWKAFDEDSGQLPKAFAVLVGIYNHFSNGLWEGPRHIGALLVVEHAPRKFHVESSFELDDKLEPWILQWNEHELQIGGPFQSE
ncbi:hypothetical protein K435DRAFT_437752 [Dendrothele bispora CBS 962.96]|uniref:Uncharacterized protein n=1 Tax=Dendrothele bispora (strain CBS 962.96) TaxID=1314807 RepID=A0A4S8MDX2_DENBC|nr:hypothetical protein K435DRAFT_437752 [Dendrothele bispora CBS 962.96]